MEAAKKRDWLNIGAIAPLAVLFTSAFGLFVGPAMSLQAEILWVVGIVIIAILVWFNAAKTQQRAREDRERLDKIIRLLEQPGTTVEDIKRVITSIGDTGHLDLAGSPITLRVHRADGTEETK
jgi:hypothetical protein